MTKAKNIILVALLILLAAAAVKIYFHTPPGKAGFSKGVAVAIKKIINIRRYYNPISRTLGNTSYVNNMFNSLGRGGSGGQAQNIAEVTSVLVLQDVEIPEVPGLPEVPEVIEILEAPDVPVESDALVLPEEQRANGPEDVEVEEERVETAMPAKIYELEAYNIKFIPDGCQEEATEPAAGQRGRLECQVSLQADSAGNIPDNVDVRLEIDGSVVKEDTIPASQAESSIYTIENYFFAIPGSHTLRFTLDPEHKFSEADKTNNVFIKTINVAAANESNDLEAQDIYVMPVDANERTNVIRADEPLLLFYSIFNKSNHKIHDVKIRVRETNASGEQIDWVNLKLPWIDARRLMTYCFELSWPDIGRHDLWLYVDFYNEVSETNEENNSKGITIEVIPPLVQQIRQSAASARQDVIAGDIRFVPKGQETAVSETTVGRLGTIHGRLSNVSGTAMDNVEFVMEADGIKIDKNTISLKPGQSADCSLREFFFDSPGAHAVKLIADPNNNIAESNESNNTTVAEIYVRERQPSDVIENADLWSLGGTAAADSGSPAPEAKVSNSGLIKKSE